MLPDDGDGAPDDLTDDSNSSYELEDDPIDDSNLSFPYTLEDDIGNHEPYGFSVKLIVTTEKLRDNSHNIAREPIARKTRSQLVIM